MASVNNTTIQLHSAEIKADKKPSLVFMTFLGILIASAVATNVFLIVALIKQRRPTSVNIGLANLAIVDILIVLVIIPMCLRNYTLKDFNSELCGITGSLGQLLTTYSLDLQCLILCGNVYNVTRGLPNCKDTFGIIRFCIISGTSFTVDAFCVIFLNVKYGVPWALPSVGYCVQNFEHAPNVRLILRIFWTIRYSAAVLLCITSYYILARFIRKNSAEPRLARQRRIYIFKIMFRTFVIWFCCYLLVSLVRTVGVKNNWPDITFQLGYFLLWLNSILKPLCQILFGPVKRVCFPWITRSVAPSAPQIAARE